MKTPPASFWSSSLKAVLRTRRMMDVKMAVDGTKRKGARTCWGQGYSDNAGEGTQ